MVLHSERGDRSSEVKGGNTLDREAMMLCLTEGTSDEKARAICELYSGRKLLKPQPLGIRANQNTVHNMKNATEAPRKSLDE